MLLNALPFLLACSPLFIRSEQLPASKSISATVAKKVRELLEAEGLPKENSNSFQTIVPPSYMIDLYHKYIEDNDQRETSSLEATSVRCILGKSKTPTCIASKILEKRFSLQ